MRTAFRPDIQGLRAIAVGSVLLFHIWPSTVTGGYVGVDVFFVISGYLIVGILAREYEESGRIDLVGFWSRRIRRLLPAATATLVLAGMAGVALLPATRWRDLSHEIAGSALYIQNVLLQFKANDYSAQFDEAGPLVHFWSLSIEEQFYIALPLLVICAARAWRGIDGGRLFQIILGLIVAVSLARSVTLIWTGSAGDYYDSLSRYWQLALGGLLVWVVPVVRLTRAAATGLALLGLAAILSAAALFDGDTAFPGYAALLPVLGSAALIVSGTASPDAIPTRVLSLRPMVWVGDLSYGIYLLHWPLIFFLGEFMDRQPDLIIGIALILASIALAWVLKTVIEDPFRHPRDGNRSKLGDLPFGGATIAMSIVLAGTIGVFLEQRSPRVQFVADAHPGAMWFEGAVPVGDARLVPDPVFAKDDYHWLHDRSCHLSQFEGELGSCELGDAAGDFVVVVAGDSHAVQWLPALEVIGQQRGWRIKTYTMASCPVMDVAMPPRRNPEQCAAWNEALIAELRATMPDLLIVARVGLNHAVGGADLAENAEIMARGTVRTWEKLRDSGIRFVAMRSTPTMRFNVPECVLEARQNEGSTGECARARDDVLIGIDPYERASEINPQVRVIDLTDWICSVERCEPVVGNVLVYRDQNHLTATYSKTLAIPLERALLEVLEN